MSDNSITEIFYLLLQAALFIGSVWIVWLLVKFLRRGDKRGINVQALVNPIKCPRCAQALPRARVPRSFNEILWGGWTCPNCGAKIDKWGKEKV
jgi:hypothetical protein